MIVYCDRGVGNSDHSHGRNCPGSCCRAAELEVYDDLALLEVVGIVSIRRVRLDIIYRLVGIALVVIDKAADLIVLFVIFIP